MQQWLLDKVSLRRVPTKESTQAFLAALLYLATCRSPSERSNTVNSDDGYLSALSPRLKATSLQDCCLHKVWGAHWSIALADHLLKSIIAEGHLKLCGSLA